jgi:hypothetical protein
MSTLTERMREPAFENIKCLLHEAASAIEALQRELADLRNSSPQIMDDLGLSEDRGIALSPRSPTSPTPT